MEYRIEQRDAMRFVGVKFYVPVQDVNVVDGAGSDTVPSFWRNLPKETYEQLAQLADGAFERVVGVFGEKDFSGGEYHGFDYWIAVESSKPCPEGMGVIENPPAKWVVFECVGPMPGAIQDAFGYVYGEFFPNTQEYDRRWEVYEIEEFSAGDTQASDYKSYAWVPVVPKGQGKPPVF